MYPGKMNEKEQQIMQKMKSAIATVTGIVILAQLSVPAAAWQGMEMGKRAIHTMIKQASEKVHNRYEAAGITDPVAFEAFFRKLQEAVQAGDKRQVAKKVHFPLRINKDGSSRYIRDEQQFLAEYDQIFSDKVKKALLVQNVQETFVNAEGVMVGNGELWLGQIGGKYVLFAVNE
ncbi:hypothetical protein [Brevibacillus sp. 1238]|uniref:hypothetical protein n=1 Tax=Brevibacillus sp. 1238 TaxID=2940565 RepID=UPI002473BECA|nr:hypothetical protein [Brevibacillus sp. 1238]MDH6348894.1 anthranilate/para-aminobenzoate synthase component I [Brevibacillus sp. 1238]